MGYSYAYDGPPSKCAKGSRPGTKALRAGVIERFGCGDDGIFNCRPTRNRGSTTLSFHADGRAWDAHGTGELNKRIAAWLVDHADELGVQEVISYRRRWDARTRKWSVYTGDDPHEQHVHVAQCIRAANTLTLTQVRAIQDGAPGPLPTPHQEDDTMYYTHGGNVYLLHGGKLVRMQTPDAIAIGVPQAPADDVTWGRLTTAYALVD